MTILPSGGRTKRRPDRQRSDRGRNTGQGERRQSRGCNRRSIALDVARCAFTLHAVRCGRPGDEVVGARAQAVERDREAEGDLAGRREADCVDRGAIGAQFEALQLFGGILAHDEDIRWGGFDHRRAEHLGHRQPAAYSAAGERHGMSARCVFDQVKAETLRIELRRIGRDIVGGHVVP